MAPASPRRFEVEAIGLENRFRFGFDGIGHGQQNRILLRGGKLRQMRSCGLGALQFVASGDALIAVVVVTKSCCLCGGKYVPILRSIAHGMACAMASVDDGHMHSGFAGGFGGA